MYFMDNNNKHTINYKYSKIQNSWAARVLILFFTYFDAHITILIRFH